MCRVAKGEPDTDKLSTGVSEHAEEQTENLGVLFERAKKKYGRKKKHNKHKTFRASGIVGVYKTKGWNTKNPICFRFAYREEDGTRKGIQRGTLKELYQAMQEKGYDFIISDIKKARAFLDENCDKDTDFKFFINNCLTGD